MNNFQEKICRRFEELIPVYYWQPIPDGTLYKASLTGNSDSMKIDVTVGLEAFDIDVSVEYQSIWNTYGVDEDEIEPRLNDLNKYMNLLFADIQSVMKRLTK